MVFVTLGTQAKDFSRCLKTIETLVKDKVITESVFAQTGHTKYKPEGIECVQFITEKEYNERISEARIVISHAGTGALFSSITQGKKVIAIARLAKYGEMVNDHQTEIVKKLSEGGYILDGTNDLRAAWMVAQTFKPKKGDFQCSIPKRIEEILDGWGFVKKDNS